MTAKEKPVNEIKELNDLITVVSTLETDVQAKLAPALNQLLANLRKRYDTLTLVKQALEQLGLDLKYLVFDLDSTRQERDEYKVLWENRP